MARGLSSWPRKTFDRFSLTTSSALLRGNRGWVPHGQGPPLERHEGPPALFKVRIPARYAVRTALFDANGLLSPPGELFLRGKVHGTLVLVEQGDQFVDTWQRKTRRDRFLREPGRQVQRCFIDWLGNDIRDGRPEGTSGDPQNRGISIGIAKVPIGRTQPGTYSSLHESQDVRCCREGCSLPSRSALIFAGALRLRTLLRNFRQQIAQQPQVPARELARISAGSLRSRLGKFGEERLDRGKSSSILSGRGEDLSQACEEVLLCFVVLLLAKPSKRRKAQVRMLFLRRVKPGPGQVEEKTEGATPFLWPVRDVPLHLAHEAGQRLVKLLACLPLRESLQGFHRSDQWRFC